MDMNKAMVEMYKQRKLLNAMSDVKSKTMDSSAKVDSQIVKKPEKRPKLEDVIASIDYKPKATFDQLYGNEIAREDVLDVVKRFQEFLKGSAKKSKRPVLISGSRGLGKTSMVESAANFAKLDLIPIRLKRLIKQTRNEFKDSMELLVRHCVANQPAIVLIDDLDRVSDKEEYCLLLSSTIMDILKEEHKLLLFCTTSSILDCILDIEFLYTVQLKRPNLDARYKILESFRESNKNLAILTNEDLRSLALKTPSFTPSDLDLMFDIAETKSKAMPVTTEHCDKAIDMVRQSFKRGTHLIGERPSITWDNIGGLSKVRDAFRDILRQIKKGDINCKFAGIALYGPPGCGKTMVAQAMANEAGFNFISIKPAELVNKFLGETEKNIRRVFSEAQEHEPCMIYFDEFDGLCGTRGNKDNVTSAVHTLLSEMDGFKNRGRSIILAATNRLEDIDPAMKRPGRLSKHIYVGLPDIDARKDILSVLTSRPGLSLGPEVDLDTWAKNTENFTGAELDFLISEAESRAIGELDRAYGDTELIHDRVELSQESFQFAMNKIRETNKDLGRKTKYVEKPLN